MHFTYCPDCGQKTVPRQMGDDGAVPYCEGCKKALFDMFSTCVLTAAVSRNGKIALLKQSYGPQDYYVGVAGYMQPGETAEQAAARELLEELSLPAASLHFLFSAWHESKGQLMLCFCAETDEIDFRLSQEVSEAKWFSPEEAKGAVRPGSIIERVVQAAIARQQTGV